MASRGRHGRKQGRQASQAGRPPCGGAAKRPRGREQAASCTILKGNPLENPGKSWKTRVFILVVQTRVTLQNEQQYSRLTRCFYPSLRFDFFLDFSDPFGPTIDPLEAADGLVEFFCEDLDL